MPRPRKNAPSGKQLSPGQAAYVLDRLVRERRVSQTDINRYVDEMGREISVLEARLQQLKEAAGPIAIAAAAGIAGAAGAVAAVRRGRKPGRKPGRPKGSGRTAAAAAPVSTAVAGGTSRRRRRSAITAEQLASRQLQGRYLALVRQFPQSKRASFARVAKERGREAAIKEMQDALKK